MRPIKSPASSRAETVILTRPPIKFQHKWELLKADPIFQQDIKLLRKVWGVNLNKPRLIVIKKDALNSLLMKHGLSKEWAYIIRCYISSNTFEPMADPHGIEIKFEKNRKTAWLKIYPETTLRDVKSAYSQLIKEFKSGKIVKTTLANKHDRDSYIYELYLKKVPYVQISKLVDDNYSERVDEFQLSKIVAKMRKRRTSL